MEQKEARYTQEYILNAFDCPYSNGFTEGWARGCGQNLGPIMPKTQDDAYTPLDSGHPVIA